MNQIVSLFAVDFHVFTLLRNSIRQFLGAVGRGLLGLPIGIHLV